VTANFSTPATLPSATTRAADSITLTGATLHAMVNPDGAATTAWFEYGLTTSYGSVSSSSNAGGGSSDVWVSISVNGLLRATNYHFRVVASNGFGVAFGADLTFNTLSGIPLVATLDPLAGAVGAMRLNGSVNPNGASATA